MLRPRRKNHYETGRFGSQCKGERRTIAISKNQLVYLYLQRNRVSYITFDKCIISDKNLENKEARCKRMTSELAHSLCRTMMKTRHEARSSQNVGKMPPKITL